MQDAPLRLQKPGAGLPFWHRLIARHYYVARRFPRLAWVDADKLFERESEKIVRLVAPLSLEVADRQVLIPRLRGIEDSSRYWSVSMTLEHLIIVGNGMAGIISLLGSGKMPGIEVDIAKVKPAGAALAGSGGATLAANFIPAMKAIRAQIDSTVKDRTGPLRFRHPWFGPITAHQWNWLLASHQAIHRKQIEAIIQRLDLKN